MLLGLSRGAARIHTRVQLGEHVSLALILVFLQVALHRLDFIGEVSNIRHMPQFVIIAFLLPLPDLLLEALDDVVVALAADAQGPALGFRGFQLPL